MHMLLIMTFSRIFSTANMLVHFFILLSQFGKVGIAHFQRMNTLTVFWKFLDQRMMFYVHGNAPLEI